MMLVYPNDVVNAEPVWRDIFTRNYLCGFTQTGKTQSSWSGGDGGNRSSELREL